MNSPIIIGSSVQGASHLHRGIECQDSYKIRSKRERGSNAAKQYYRDLEDDVKIIAVADGHGSSSCPYSKLGSNTATNVFCDIMAELYVKYRDSQNIREDERTRQENSIDFRTYLSRDGDTQIAFTIWKEWIQRIIRLSGLVHEPRPNEKDPKELHDYCVKFGTTLIGVLFAKEYIFILQFGDGNVMFVDDGCVEEAIITDKILGVETHSLSSANAWKNAYTKVINLNNNQSVPCMYMITTDGMANSFSSETEFKKTCRGYFEAIKKYGVQAVNDNLRVWLRETSQNGCGDDITAVIAYYS